MTWATDRAAATVARTLREAGETGTLRRKTSEVYDPATRSVTGGTADSPIVLVPADWTNMPDGSGALMRVRRLLLSPPGVVVEPGHVVLDAAGVAYTVMRADLIRLHGAVVAITVLAAGGAP